VAVGKYSYGVYLLHMPVRDLLLTLGWRPEMVPTGFGSQAPAQLAFSAAVAAATFVPAWLSWHLFERHFLQLKRFFPADLLHTAPAERRENSQAMRRAANERRGDEPAIATGAGLVRIGGWA
jgi:peptidoglycan/LPS O-acetylase OafA/YrhL